MKKRAAKNIYNCLVPKIFSLRLPGSLNIVLTPAVTVMTSVRLPCKLSAARQAVPVPVYPVFVQTADRVR